MASIQYPLGLNSVLMTKTRTQGASFMQYQPRSGAAYTKNTSTDNPVFFNISFRFRQVDAQRFFAWFKGPLQEGRLPFTVPMRTEFGLANQEVRFYAAQGDTILDHSQEGSVHTYTGTVFASSLAYPDDIEDNWDFVASPFWQYRGEWDFALNSMTPVAKFIELNFASRFYVKNEYMVSLVEVLSFSRASVGTDFVGGVLADFPVDAVRVGDGGLLIEGEKTNVLTNTKNLTGWNAPNVSLAISSELAPKQLDFFTRVVPSLGVSQKTIAKSSTLLSAGEPVTTSVFAKKGELDKFQIRWFGGATGVSSKYANFDLSLGVFSGSCQRIEMIKIGVTDIYLCIAGDDATGTMTGGQDTGFEIISSLSDGRRPNFNGDGVSGLYFYGAMSEVGYKSSYIESESTPETRQPDFATIDVSDISEKSGSYLIEFSNDGIVYGRCIASAYIDNQNSINAYISQSGQIVMIATKHGFSQSVFVSGTPVIGGCRVGVSYSDASATISVNGVSQSISGDWSNEMHTVALGMDDHGEMHLNSHISYFKFNPESATESELNQWTGA